MKVQINYDDVRKAVKSGKSCTEVAVEFNCSVASVRAIAKDILKKQKEKRNKQILKLREILDETGRPKLTIEEIAAKVGCHRQTVSSILHQNGCEKGERVGSYHVKKKKEKAS